MKYHCRLSVPSHCASSTVTAPPHPSAPSATGCCAVVSGWLANKFVRKAWLLRARTTTNGLPTIRLGRRLPSAMLAYYSAISSHLQIRLSRHRVAETCQGSSIIHPRHKVRVNFLLEKNEYNHRIYGLNTRLFLLHIEHMQTRHILDHYSLEQPNNTSASWTNYFIGVKTLFTCQWSII